MTERSAAYEAFHAQFLGPRTSDMVREGPLFQVLAPLTVVEREEAARALLERLKAPRPRGVDPWAVSALGRLARMGTPAPDGTVTLLREFLSQGRKSTRAEVALALWDITHDESMPELVISLTRGSALGAWIQSKIDPLGGDFGLIEVIHTLAQFPQEAARRRLEELSSDPRYLIRYNAQMVLGLRGPYYGIEDRRTT